MYRVNHAEYKIEEIVYMGFLIKIPYQKTKKKKKKIEEIATILLKIKLFVWPRHVIHHKYIFV